MSSFLIDKIDSEIAFAKLQRSFNRIGQAGARGFLFFFITFMRNDETVYNGFDGVLFVAVKFDLIIQRMRQSHPRGRG